MASPLAVRVYGRSRGRSQIQAPSSVLTRSVGETVRVAESASATLGNQFFVATTGSNGAAGTFGAPWQTIEYGIEHISAGDTLYIRGGTYTESLSDGGGVVFPSGTSWINAVTISAYPTETVTVKPSSGAALSLSNTGGVKTYLVFNEIIFDGSLLSGVSQLIAIGGGGGNHIRLVNCEGATISGGNVVFVSYDASFIEFIGGRYHGGRYVSGNGGYGFYASATDCLFDGVDVYDCDNVGINLYVSTADHPGETVDRNVIANCHVHDINITAPYSNAIGITMGGGGGVAGTDNVLMNTVVSDFAGYGVSIWYDNTKAYHNTVVRISSGNPGLDTGSAANTMDIRNNIFAHTGGVNFIGTGLTQANNLFFNGTSGATGSDSSGDPDFVNDVAHGDYHLQSSSPARNAGANLLATVATDKDGVARDTAPDVGAYEFV